jgi:anti-sigma B factor antagonist
MKADQGGQAQEADVTAVALRGEIDLESSPAAREQLLAAVEQGKPVTVDLGEVSYMDSSGLASLLEAFQKARAAGIEFRLARVGGSVQKVLALSRLDKVFTIV